MTSLQTEEAEDRIEEWLGVPMFFAGLTVPDSERLLRKAGFELEVSEFRKEVDPIDGPGGHHWAIARRPADRLIDCGEDRRSRRSLLIAAGG